jgi:hypothetical protein
VLPVLQALIHALYVYVYVTEQAPFQGAPHHCSVMVVQDEGQGSDDDEGVNEEWDGVMDRDFIKHRASKVSQRHASTTRT